MKKVKMFLVAATLIMATSAIFAFKSNHKFVTVTTLYVNGVEVATPSGSTTHWFDNSQSSTAFLASINYNSLTRNITYDGSTQVYFKP